MAKAVTQSALDAPLTREDKEKLLDYLATNGGLDKAYKYVNDGAAGYAELPAAGDHAGIPADPLDMMSLIRAGFGSFAHGWHEITQQPLMFQPVGGIDALPRAFAARLRDRVRYGAEVTAIRKTPAGVRIAYTSPQTGAATIEGAYCICTIPLPVLRTIPADFSAPFAASMRRVAYMESVKIGLAMKRRFWEEDDRIMSGITRTDQTITQIWYPSYGYFGRNGGVLTAAYASDAAARTIGDLSPADRTALALRQGLAIHPQYADEFASGLLGCVAENAAQHGRVGELDARNAQERLSGAQRARRRDLSCRRAHELHQRLASGRARVGARRRPTSPRPRTRRLTAAFPSGLRVQHALRAES